MYNSIRMTYFTDYLVCYIIKLQQQQTNKNDSQFRFTKKNLHSKMIKFLFHMRQTEID